ncbi:MAG TPA: hypothetical protein VK009_18900 [Chloroflexota bacterium]|nr:hypothetical protein [Chloroflexota bacterium]
MSCLVPAAVRADSGDWGSRVEVGENKRDASFTATITTSNQGIWVDVHGQSNAPAHAAAAPASAAPAPTTNFASTAPPSSAPAAQPADDRPAIVSSWYDPIRGYFSQTSDGNVVGLEGMNVNADANSPGGWFQVGEQQHPGTVPMALTVNGQYQDTVWVPYPNTPDNVNWGPPQTAPPNTMVNGSGNDPYQVALDVLGHIPLPNILLKMNPDTGLVAMPGWFWIANYDGRPFGASRTVTIPGPPGQPPTSFTVTVRVWPAEYDWLFGDGQSLTTNSLGEPYPQESDIQHIYQFSSFRFSRGFPVDCTVHFAAQFQVNGGGWQPLPTILHTYGANYPVQEAQSILQKRSGS